MNIFEMSRVLSIVFGAVHGGVCAQSPNFILIVCGAVIGAAIGIICWVTMMGMFALAMRVLETKSNVERMTPAQCLVTTLVMFSAMLAAVPAAWIISGIVVSWIFSSSSR